MLTELVWNLNCSSSHKNNKRNKWLLSFNLYKVHKLWNYQSRAPSKDKAVEHGISSGNTVYGVLYPGICCRKSSYVKRSEMKNIKWANASKLHNRYVRNSKTFCFISNLLTHIFLHVTQSEHQEKMFWLRHTHASYIAYITQNQQMAIILL
jgi:hypothetical protein